MQVQERESASVGVRPAEATDARLVAEAHVRAWQEAYRGLLDPDFLDSLTVESWLPRWQQLLSGEPDHPIAVVELDGRVSGFASFGASRDDGADGLGELYAINIHPDRWGHGAGWALCAHVEGALREMGFSRAVLWVVPGNVRARRFYEARGWRCDEVERTATVLGTTAREVRYSRDLAPVARRP